MGCIMEGYVDFGNVNDHKIHEFITKVAGKDWDYDAVMEYTIYFKKSTKSCLCAIKYDNSTLEKKVLVPLYHESEFKKIMEKK